jgi:peptidoglycan/LPS O-acetylase OafA/YrhL
VQSTNLRFASLDGFRALSIAFVIVGHVAGTRGFPSGGSMAAAPFLASVGVRVFFVISGFLITRLLLIEQEKQGHIRLSTFYFRRAFRILIPYYAFLAVVAVVSREGYLHLAPGDLGYALVYLTNYSHSAWAIQHTWSLAVEEQFYLLWPALLVVLGVRRSLWIAGASLLAAPCWRLFLWYVHPAARDGIGHAFGTVADALAAGCLLAGVREKLWNSARYRALLASRWFVVVPIAVLATGVFQDRPRIAFTLGVAVLNLGVALCIDRCLRFPGQLSTRLLTWRPIVTVGRASYSIYLWQQLFLDRSSSAWTAAFPVNVLLVVGVSTVACHLIEKPSLAARVRAEAWFERLFPLRGRVRRARSRSATLPAWWAGRGGGNETRVIQSIS